MRRWGAEGEGGVGESGRREEGGRTGGAEGFAAWEAQGTLLFAGGR